MSLAAADPLVMDLHPATPAREVLSAERLLLLPPRSTAGQGLPRSTRPEDYLLRPAEFWVAMEAGIFQQDLRAQAPNRLLAAEQDRSLSPATSSGFGLLVGRTWRNGTRLATGLAHHVEEHAFLYDTRRDSLSWDVQESVTVLDTLVIAQAIDSVANLHPLGGRTSGNTRFETWVVPVEAGWGTRRGRWSLELLSGLVWERRRWTGGPQLTSSGEGPGASVREAHAAAVEVRRTDVLGLRAGLMLGFWPAERLVLSAGPWHDRGITLLSNEGALHRRTGVRVRLAFLLQRPGR